MIPLDLLLAVSVEDEADSVDESDSKILGADSAGDSLSNLAGAARR